MVETLLKFSERNIKQDEKNYLFDLILTFIKGQVS